MFVSDKGWNSRYIMTLSYNCEQYSCNVDSLLKQWVHKRTHDQKLEVGMNQLQGATEVTIHFFLFVQFKFWDITQVVCGCLDSMHVGYYYYVCMYLRNKASE